MTGNIKNLKTEKRIKFIRELADEHSFSFIFITRALYIMVILISDVVRNAPSLFRHNIDSLNVFRYVRYSADNI